VAINSPWILQATTPPAPKKYKINTLNEYAAHGMVHSTCNRWTKDAGCGTCSCPAAHKPNERSPQLLTANRGRWQGRGQRYWVKGGQRGTGSLGYPPIILKQIVNKWNRTFRLLSPLSGFFSHCCFFWAAPLCIFCFSLSAFGAPSHLHRQKPRDLSSAALTHFPGLTFSNNPQDHTQFLSAVTLEN